MSAAMNIEPVVLVRPPVLVAKWAHASPTCPPVGLAYVASSLLAAGFPVSVVDAIGEKTEQHFATSDPRFYCHGLMLEEIIAKIPPTAKIIGLSCMFSHEWPIVRELISLIKKNFKNATLIIGGEHATALPEFSIENCPELDIAVLGEGEEIVVQLVNALINGGDLSEVSGLVFRKDGRPFKTKPHARIRVLDDIPEPAWHLFPITKYLDKGYGFGVNRGRSMPVVATRGCPYQCTFCSSPSMWGTNWIARSPEKVLAEIEKYIDLYQADNIDFYDLTAIVQKKWVLDFGKLIKLSKRTFSWQLPSGTRSEAIDAEVCQTLYESGCRNISYAPESGSADLLKRIKKKVDLKRMKVSMLEAIDVGINSKANIMMGFPGETHKDIFKTLIFCAQVAWLGLHDLSISPFSPYPGSELYMDIKKNQSTKDLTDEYFFSLAAYTDITRAISYSEHISNRVLNIYRLSGMMLFYVVMYARRPHRFFISVKNIFSDRQESRLEMSLRDLFLRLLPKPSSQLK